MIKALAIKELRESIGLAALAGLGMVWAIARLTGVNLFGNWMGNYFDPGQTIAFVNDDFGSKAALFIGGLAVALGLKQTAWERGRDTFYYLLSRPISRRAVFGTKIVVGLVLVLAVLAVAIGAYGWWASIPGKKPAPFEWSMTLSAWKLALSLPLVYLGAFISGLRPAKWFGTRLIPLAAAIFWTVFVGIVPMTWLAMLLYALGYLCAIVAIFYFAESSDF